MKLKLKLCLEKLHYLNSQILEHTGTLKSSSSPASEQYCSDKDDACDKCDTIDVLRAVDTTYNLIFTKDRE